VGADPNACVTIDATREQKMAKNAACKAHQYQNCTWEDNMEWMALWWAPGPTRAQLPVFWVPGNMEVAALQVGSTYRLIVDGMQFRLPFPKLVPGDANNPECGVPSLTEECIDVPGNFRCEKGVFIEHF
jgi:hypothetical protein